MGLKNQVLDLLRFGNVLAGIWDELFVAALLALFVALVRSDLALVNEAGGYHFWRR